MKFHYATSDLYIPTGEPAETVLPRTTHLAIGAHQDDLEIFAYHGILACFQQEGRQFGGVTVTDGAGSPRSGPYSDYSDEQMKQIRVDEQRKAALVGEYGFVAQLAYPSKVIKDPADTDAVEDLEAILSHCSPEVLYLHNPFDKHDTHVAVMTKCLAAVRRLPKEKRPAKILGCEVWRDLDWLPDSLKVPLNVDRHPNLSAALLGVFDSQISGGKRYDLAADGRRLANATFFQSHAVDTCDRITFAVDMTPLFHADDLALEAFVDDVLGSFSSEIHQRIRKSSP